MTIRPECSFGPPTAAAAASDLRPGRSGRNGHDPRSRRDRCRCSSRSAAAQAHVDPKHLVLAPTEVAILPAKIEVVAARDKAAQAEIRTCRPPTSRAADERDNARAGRRKASGPLLWASVAPTLATGVVGRLEAFHGTRVEHRPLRRSGGRTAGLFQADRERGHPRQRDIRAMRGA